MKKLLIILLPVLLLGCEKYNQLFPQKGEEITLVCEGKESRLNPNFKYTYQEREIERTYHLKNELTNNCRTVGSLHNEYKKYGLFFAKNPKSQVWQLEKV